MNRRSIILCVIGLTCGCSAPQKLDNSTHSSNHTKTDYSSAEECQSTNAIEIQRYPEDEIFLNNVQSIEFQITNTGDKPFGFNPNDYSLYYKPLKNAEWTDISPSVIVQPWRILESGDSFSLELAVADTDSARINRPGWYRFSISGQVNDRCARVSRTFFCR